MIINNFTTKIILLEGCDGSGKTNMATSLSNYFNSIDEKIKSIVICYPNKESFGYGKIREILKDTNAANIMPDIIQSLFILNIRDHIEKILNKYLKENPLNTIIFMDRFTLSTIIYNILNKGNLLTNILYYLDNEYSITKENYEDYCLNNNYQDRFSSKIFDLINKEFCSLEKMINKVYLLQPPIDVLINHSLSRLRQGNAEINDTEDSIMKQYKLYENIFYNLSKDDSDRFIKIDQWNKELDEVENYKIIENIMINDILKGV